MAGMIDLALTDEDRKNHSKMFEPDDSGDGPKYPWGLRLHFNEETMEKIGELPPVGTEVELTIKAKVTEHSIEEVEIGDTTKMRKSGAVQVTALAFPETQKKTDADRAAGMYPNQGD
jgi:hypothetical protein